MTFRVRSRHREPWPTAHEKCIRWRRRWRARRYLQVGQDNLRTIGSFLELIRKEPRRSCKSRKKHFPSARFKARAPTGEISARQTVGIGVVGIHSEHPGGLRWCDRYTVPWRSTRIDRAPMLCECLGNTFASRGSAVPKSCR
jgi:hypothetical protein